MKALIFVVYPLSPDVTQNLLLWGLKCFLQVWKWLVRSVEKIISCSKNCYSHPEYCFSSVSMKSKNPSAHFDNSEFNTFYFFKNVVYLLYSAHMKVTRARYNGKKYRDDPSPQKIWAIQNWWSNRENIWERNNVSGESIQTDLETDIYIENLVHNKPGHGSYKIPSWM